MQNMRIAVLMDPIETVNIEKDSTFAMMLESQRRGYELAVLTQSDLSYSAGEVCARVSYITVLDDLKKWFHVLKTDVVKLSDFDVLLMRKDPPFDMEYIYTTYLLELVQSRGTWVINDPRSLRDWNEKMSTLLFPQCTPPTLVTRSADQLREFLSLHHDVIFKPLEAMGGARVFRVQLEDPNISVIIETLTSHGQEFIMAQKYIPEIVEGDKRILMIDGEPIPFALARVPKKGELRGNLAAGGIGKGLALNDRDRWICSQVGPILKAKGLMFVGLDVIGDYLTEINITSPTCIRELDDLYQLNIAGVLFDAIEKNTKDEL